MYYDNKSNLVNISNSILKHFGIDTFHETQEELDGILKNNPEKKICLCLFDGLGKYIQELHPESAKDLLEKKRFEITSVFPPTTVAATTALMSSKYPCETGWLGWAQRIGDYKNPVTMFMSKDDLTQEEVFPHTFETYKYKNIIDRINDSGKKADEIKSFELKEDSISSFFNVVQGKLKSNDFLYAYHVEPDGSLHEFGTKSERVSKIISKLDRGFVDLAEKNPDVLFVVLADHGHIDTKYFLISEHLDFLDCLTKKLNFLEPRSAVFYVKEERKAEFEKLFDKYYGKYFTLYSKSEVKAKKIFGEGTPHRDFDEFIGDYLAVSQSEYAIVNSKEKMDMISHHAGGTLQERIINVSIFNDG